MAPFTGNSTQLKQVSSPPLRVLAYLCHMIRVGKIVATHGLHGTLILTHIVGNSKWLKTDQALLVEMQKGSYIPYFLTGVKATNDEEYLVNIENILKVEEARRLVGKQVYVDEALLADYAKQSPLLWIGFDLVDTNHGNLGLVADVLQTGSQWLAKVMYKDAEVLIPLIEETIEKLDIKARKLTVTIPDGLLEIYTG